LPIDKDFALGTVVIKFRVDAQSEMEANLDRLINKKADEEKHLQEKIDIFGGNLKALVESCEAFMKEPPTEVNTESLQAKLSSAEDRWGSLQNLSKELEVIFNYLLYSLKKYVNLNKCPLNYGRVYKHLKNIFIN